VTYFTANPNLFGVSAANAAVAITLQAGRARNMLSGVVYWSYSGDPTGGLLTIAGGGLNFSVDITAGGPGFVPFYTPIRAADDNAIVITLSAGGDGIVGRLNIMSGGTV